MDRKTKGSPGRAESGRAAPGRALATLGLARRAGRAVCGELAVEKSIRAGAFLVILATDASAGTRKKFEQMCYYYHVPLVSFGTKGELGSALGRDGYCACAALNDDGFAELMKRQISTENEEGRVWEK